ncbi:MAG TPA: alpha/beta hydrolase [Candidatus Binataceae bacterium]|nr:alpha/beta hydrolase [Candidatus Binataceae bacterium]
MSAESRFVSANGLRLHYLDFGNPSKPPLICIHGLSGNAHNFDGLAPHLTADHHVMSIDVRGRGDSQWGPPGEYAPPIYVSDLAAMLDALEFDRVTLIGTSMGGIISMIFAGGYPHRVDRLVLNDIGPEVDPAGLKRITDYFTDAPTNFADLTEVAAYYRANYPFLANTPEPELIEFARWAVKPADDGRLTWKIDPAVRNIPRTGAAARPLDMWVPFARITARTLVIRGATSDILAPDTAARMCRVLPGSKLVEIPGVGHAPTLSEPAAVAAIRAFLAR